MIKTYIEKDVEIFHVILRQIYIAPLKSPRLKSQMYNENAKMKNGLLAKAL